MLLRLTPWLPHTLLVAALALPVWAVNYLTLTDSETTRFGDRIKWYCQMDTIRGPIRSNSTIAGCPDGVHVFTDIVLGDIYCPSTCVFLVPPILNPPPVYFPQRLDSLRRRAGLRSRFYDFPGEHYQVLLRGAELDVYHSPVGHPFDPNSLFTIALRNFTEYVFFDGPVTLSGVLEGDLQIGCSGRLGIADDVRYVDADPLTGITPDTSRNFLTLASEGEIKILNTPANGRENSGGLGYSQTDPALTDVVITAGIYALGESFTFDQQNDPDSGYVCECTPDERGDFYLYGGLVERRRGYVHRSNRNSTGYRRQMRFDPRWVTHDDQMGFPAWDEDAAQTTDSLNFGSVQLDSAAWDTAHVYTGHDVYLGTVVAPLPYTAFRPSPAYGHEFHIPVRFVPTRVEPYNRTMTLVIGSETVLVRLTGRGIDTTASDITSDLILSPLSFSLSSAPNPFNARTVLAFDLPAAAPVRVELFDLAGRSVGVLADGAYPAGTHRLPVDGGALSTGIYFARLSTPRHVQTVKLALIK